MSTIEDFKNAPIGATATRDDGLMAIKISDGERCWLTPTWICHNDEEMARRGYLLDPFVPWIPTAREALNLAWERAHEVKEGQVIPGGVPYLMKDASGMGEYTAHFDFEIRPHLASIVRTLKPLPDPVPDWLDAPAILASHPLCADTERIGIWLPSLYKDDMWELPVQQGEFRVHWSELEDVTPLYPKETDR